MYSSYRTYEIYIYFIHYNIHNNIKKIYKSKFIFLFNIYYVCIYIIK